MNFYEQVKSPIDNEEFLRSLILLYAEKCGGGRKYGEIVFEDDHAYDDYIYEAFITNPESESMENNKTYMENFRKYVEKDTVCKLLMDVLKYTKEEAEQIYNENFGENEPNTEDNIVQTASIKNKDDFIHALQKAGCIEMRYDDHYHEMSLREIIEDVFDGHGSMGYHIYESKFGNMWAGGDSIVKLYINVGADTYEFSKLFREKCEEIEKREEEEKSEDEKKREDKLSGYMYKVVNPRKGEEVRADKMCIYSSLKDIEKFVEIIKSIKNEHPDFDYRQASPIMGNIDGWIGVGADPINFKYARSYSQSRALLFENALRKVFGNKSKEEIERLSQNPNIIKKVKNAIKKEAAKYVITQHLVFDDVIIEAFKSSDPKERDSIYDKHRNRLYDRLKSGELPKQSIWQKIKTYLLSERGSKKKLKPEMQQPPYQLEILPDCQIAYSEEEQSGDIPTTQQSISMEEQYRQSLKVDISVSENNNGVPMQQTARYGENNEVSENDIDIDDDSSDVWI